MKAFKSPIVDEKEKEEKKDVDERIKDMKKLMNRRKSKMVMIGGSKYNKSIMTLRQKSYRGTFVTKHGTKQFPRESI